MSVPQNFKGSEASFCVSNLINTIKRQANKVNIKILNIQSVFVWEAGSNSRLESWTLCLLLLRGFCCAINDRRGVIKAQNHLGWTRLPRTSCPTCDWPQPCPYPRALSATYSCSLDTYRDKDSRLPWAVPCSAWPPLPWRKSCWCPTWGCEAVLFPAVPVPWVHKICIILSHLI